MGVDKLMRVKSMRCECDTSEANGTTLEGDNEAEGN